MNRIKQKLLIMNRIITVAFCLMLQVAVILLLVFAFSDYAAWTSTLLTLLSIIVLLWIIRKRQSSEGKLAWTILILGFPLFGGFLYVLLGGNSPRSPLMKRIRHKESQLAAFLQSESETIEELQARDAGAAGQSKYLLGQGFPLWKNSKSTYYASGEQAWHAMLEDLRRAEKYIFMEYFIIETGMMWDAIVDILEEKAAAGVDVRVMYDDVGCLALLPKQYKDVLKKKGIQCTPFNPFQPVLSVMMNNRDHRKILVIDGRIAYTGGINLADEYINVKHKYGHWRDNAIRLEGSAVWSFTIMFLQLWNAANYIEESPLAYKPPEELVDTKSHIRGFVQPYCDSPKDAEHVGENVYLNIINQAKRYIYIFTPYLIITNEMTTALALAAKRGVTVRIITPGIPDKKLVFQMTRSYYDPLVSNGVEIWEYTPGFVHSKVFVCDDEIGAVGTINMDFRSLMLHYECGVWMYRTDCIDDIKKDFEEALLQSRRVTMKDCRSGFFQELLRSVLRIFAPLF